MSFIFKSILSILASLSLLFWCGLSVCAEDTTPPKQELLKQHLPTLNTEQLTWLSQQIYQNECNRKPACLTAWNAGEDFPSLGIGHFIWYRTRQAERFSETFPNLLAYLQENGITLPAWLTSHTAQPWPDQASFIASQSTPRMQELRELLLTTQQLQASFIVQRFNQMVASNQFVADTSVHSKLVAIANDNPPYGLYALIDYVHFKGEGSNPTEQYEGHGWGLRHVLAAMPQNSAKPLVSFVEAAKATLNQRVASAPPERNEQRWLAGWHNRLDTYLPHQ